MAKKDDRTNVMRVLDAAGISYKAHALGCDEALSGVEVATRLGVNPEKMFKTLVTTGRSGNHYVFMVPVAEELDLKKAAAASGEKNIEMLKSKDLLGLTGYIHGGCSPIGMKKYFRTFIDETAELHDTVFFSAGRIGFQIEMAPGDICKMIQLEFADIC